MGQLRDDRDRRIVDDPTVFVIGKLAIGLDVSVIELARGKVFVAKLACRHGHDDRDIASPIDDRRVIFYGQVLECSLLQQTGQPYPNGMIHSKI
jgi:hypothetical protein